MILDLFSGPRGWDVGGRELGIDAIGIEYDAAACATSRAAGFQTIRADVATYPLAHLPRVEGLIASPPCQAFSTAGNGEGRDWLGELHTHARRVIYGWEPWPYDTDPRIALVLEPLRWATVLVPDWIALEQVPPVLELWRTFAEVFSALGWKCWTGTLNAADYGVPQTRERAFLLAHRRFQPQPPEPTHCRGGAQTMFGELSPWVSMADALGWGMTERPHDTIVGGHSNGTNTRGSRERLAEESQTERWVARYQRGTGMTDRYGARPDRPMDEPAPTLTGSALGAGAGAKMGFVRTGTNSMKHSRRTEDMVPYERSIDEPAPTVDAKAGGAWTLLTNRGQDEDGNRQTRDGSAPAPALSAKAGGQWAFTEPATTIAADPRITARCHHDEGSQGRDAKTTDQVRAGDYDGTEPIKLTIRDALILQSFPPDYPVQGTKTKQFEQIGNAVPPRLAKAVLASLQRGAVA